MDSDCVKVTFVSRTYANRDSRGRGGEDNKMKRHKTKNQMKGKVVYYEKGMVRKLKAYSRRMYRI